MKLGLVLVIVACSGGKAPPTTGSGSSAPVASSCEAARAKVEQLYRAEASIKEPKRVEGAVADNTQMVMNDCARDPAKVAACLERVSTVPELEASCLRPLDEEGTEGNELP